MSETPPPVDRGKVAILWILQCLVAIFLVVLGFVTVLLPFEPTSWRIDPSTVPAGMSYEVIESATGSAAYIKCPSMIRWARGDRAPVCADAVHSTTVSVALSGLATAVAFGLYVLLRRARRNEKYRAKQWVSTPDRPSQYRQRAMPIVFWIALTLWGSLTALLTVVGFSNFQSDPIEIVIGVTGFFGTLIEIVWVHGLRRAYRVSVDDDVLRWTAPLRSVNVPFAAVVGIEVPTAGPWNDPARVGHIRTASTKALPVGLPDAYHRWLFSAFCDSLRDRGVLVHKASDR